MAEFKFNNGLLHSARTWCNTLPGSIISSYCENASDAELAFNLCFQLLLWGAFLVCAGLYVKVRIEDHEIHQECLKIRKSSLVQVMNRTKEERKDSGVDVGEKDD
jgi:hypothetical protein